MMEVDSLKSLQRFYDAENEYVQADAADRDIAVMLKELHPDVVVHVPDSLPHGGTWRGHDGFARLFDAVTEHWAVFEVVYDDAKWHPLDDQRVLTEGRLRAVLRKSGLQVNMPVVSLFTFTPQGMSHLDHFYKDTAALVSAGTRREIRA